jgi:ethanolamine utilization protein EutQ (cupin superfamily)
MPTLIKKPIVVEAGGNLPMLIEEFVGRYNTGTEGVSVSRMLSPAGRVETRNTPEFDEYVVVLEGVLRIESQDGVVDVHAGQGAIVRRGRWVRYSTPEKADYIAVCQPAFSPRMMKLDKE